MKPSTALLLTLRVALAFTSPSHLHLSTTTRRTSNQQFPPPYRRHYDKVEISLSAETRATSASTSYLSTLSAETRTTSASTSLPVGDADVPVVSEGGGMYRIETKEQYAALLKTHPDKLIVIKFFAPYCRACKVLDPKFAAVKNDPQLKNLPIVWAEFAAKRTNKDFFRTLAILSLPTVHFYDTDGLVENFACGPAKVPLLKKKLAAFLNTRVDPNTLKLKEAVKKQERSDEPRKKRELSIGNELITDEHREYLRTEIPFFRDLKDEEFDDMIKKATLQSFNAGDVIVRQGEPGRTFFVIKSGIVEMSIKSSINPISTPPTYLGAAVSELTKFDYFGERALTTGEPYAASFRVLEKTRCFAFNVEDIPESSILSKKRRATHEMIEKLSERYELPEDYTPATFPSTSKDESILELLVRFKQIRQAAKCFEYVMNTEPNWGDVGEIARRSLLVSKLSKSQRDEFKEVFDIADVKKSGKINLLDMRKFMESAREKKTDEELLEMINRANPLVDGYTSLGITLDEFLGVMAEADFFNLFTETFQELDRDSTGYVRAGDLDQVLGGVRDLISDDHKSIIDVEDKDVLIDYEQFSKMLLGAAL